MLSLQVILLQAPHIANTHGAYHILCNTCLDYAFILQMIHFIFLCTSRPFRTLFSPSARNPYNTTVLLVVDNTSEDIITQHHQCSHLLYRRNSWTREALHTWATHDPYSTSYAAAYKNQGARIKSDYRGEDGIIAEEWVTPTRARLARRVYYTPGSSVARAKKEPPQAYPNARITWTTSHRSKVYYIGGRLLSGARLHKAKLDRLSHDGFAVCVCAYGRGSMARVMAAAARLPRACLMCLSAGVTMALEGVVR